MLTWTTEPPEDFEIAPLNGETKVSEAVRREAYRVFNETIDSFLESEPADNKTDLEKGK